MIEWPSSMLGLTEVKAVVAAESPAKHGHFPRCLDRIRIPLRFTHDTGVTRTASCVVSVSSVCACVRQRLVSVSKKFDKLRVSNTRVDGFRA